MKGGDADVKYLVDNRFWYIPFHNYVHRSLNIYLLVALTRINVIHKMVHNTIVRDWFAIF